MFNGNGGNAIIIVADVEASVKFYTEVLGLTLGRRLDDRHVMIEAGKGFSIMIHGPSPQFLVPGTRGAMALSLVSDEPFDTTVARLEAHGIEFMRKNPAGTVGFAHFRDPDGIHIVFSAPVRR